MNADNLFLQALNITVIGMLVVFVFLTLLVFVVKLLGKIVKVLEVYFPQETAPAASIAQPTANNALLAVAIAAAKRFKNK